MSRIACVVLASLIAAGAGAAEIDDLKRMYDYDAAAPLEAKETLVRERDGAKVFDVSYASPMGGRASAYLVVPGTPRPHAGIVFGHWGQGVRSEFLPEAILYARSGAVSLLVDYPWDRSPPSRRALKQVQDPESDHRAYVQAVADIRRGFDLLCARNDIDASRLAYVGHSYGAQWGAILSAIEPRIRGAALVGGAPDAASIWRDNNDPGIVEYRANVPSDKREAYLAACRRTDAVRYVPHARCPLLFQFANFERYFDEAAMRRYGDVASGPKVVRWYDTGHELNDVQALYDRAAWLHERVGIGAIRPGEDRQGR